jgi:hypothetical protein
VSKPISIEISLENVFTDENGYPSESVEESIRRQVVQEITRTCKGKIDSEIVNVVHSTVTKLIDDAVAEKVPGMIEMLLNERYTPMTSWGEKHAPTSVREELIKRFRDEFQYTKPDRYGNHTRTKFSDAVDKFVQEKLSEFKKEFNETVGKEFNAQAMKYVAEMVAKKFASA